MVLAFAPPFAYPLDNGDKQHKRKTWKARRQSKRGENAVQDRAMQGFDRITKHANVHYFTFDRSQRMFQKALQSHADIHTDDANSGHQRQKLLQRVWKCTSDNNWGFVSSRKCRVWRSMKYSRNWGWNKRAKTHTHTHTKKKKGSAPQPKGHSWKRLHMRPQICDARTSNFSKHFWARVEKKAVKAFFWKRSRSCSPKAVFGMKNNPRQIVEHRKKTKFVRGPKYSQARCANSRRIWTSNRAAQHAVALSCSETPCFKRFRGHRPL